MESSTTTTCSLFQIIPSPPSLHHLSIPSFTFNFPLSSSKLRLKGGICSSIERQRRITSVESYYSYDKPIPEQIIDKPVGLSVGVKHIGDQDQPCCSHCQAKGAVLCPTCTGSGLYVDSIMECQGILLKVRCLGCGGTGNTMCSECGGRGHL